jgi:hypothetical protein
MTEKTLLTLILGTVMCTIPGIHAIESQKATSRQSDLNLKGDPAPDEVA